jgi:hypothetical protein
MMRIESTELSSEYVTGEAVYDQSVLGPDDLLIIRMPMNTNAESVERFIDGLRAFADGALKDRCVVIAADQAIVVKKP